ncbi:MAG: energy transducer TonB [Flavobacteriales bacterium]
MLTATALALFTLLCITLSDDLAWDNVTRSTRNELVFHERHRGYGAFVLRRDYDRRFLFALLLALGLLGGLVGASYLFAPQGITVVPPHHVVDWELDQVYDAPLDAPAPKRTSAPAPSTPTPPDAGRDPGPVEAGAAVDSIKADTPPQVDTAAFGDGTNKGPAGPGSDPGPDDGGTGDGSSSGSIGGTREIAEVDVQPEFPGGHARMMEYVQRHIRFPESDGRKQKVHVQFVVDTDGHVLDVTAKGGAPRAYAVAAEDVVKGMPAWVPAMRKGYKVACRLVLPISFETK